MIVFLPLEARYSNKYDRKRQDLNDLFLNTKMSTQFQ